MMSLFLASLFGTAHAVPMQLSQQGRLVDSSGAAAAGNHNLTFRLYNAGTGGTLLWNETVSTNFTNGYYSVVLGSDTINNPLEDSVLESGDLYVEIEIDSDGPLTPRSAVTSAPFARVAGKAQSADWGGLTSVPSGLDTADSRISALESLMTTVQSDLATANTTISTLQSDLSTTQGDLATAQSDLAAAQGDLVTANTTIASLESSLAENNTDIASNTSSINALETDLTAAEASIATLQTDVSGISDNVLDMISVDTTWNIGSNGDYTDLADAMAAARSVRIHPDATLTLQLEDGVYSHTSGINLYHPNGRHLRIQGNTSDKEAVQLYFVGSDGLYLDNGDLRGLSYLHIVGNSTSGTIGLNVIKNATLFADNLMIEDFKNNMITRYDSYSQLLGDSTIQNALSDNINVSENSVFLKSGTTTALDIIGAGANGVSLNYSGVASMTNTHVTGSSDDGLDPRWGSVINFDGGSTSNNNGSDGIQVQFGSSIRAYDASFDNNSGSGIWNYHGGTGYYHGITASNNSALGFANSRNSSVRITGGTFNGNGNYGISTYDNSNAEVNSITTSGNSPGQRFTNSDSTSNYSNQ